MLGPGLWAIRPLPAQTLLRHRERMLTALLHSGSLKADSSLLVQPVPNATLRRIIHCVIYGFKSDTLIQLSRPLKLSGVGQS